MRLGEALGGEVLIESLTNAIKDFSLLYAGTPDERAASHLESFISRIAPTIVEAVGSHAAIQLLEIFRGAVMGCKHEIEADGMDGRA